LSDAMANLQMYCVLIPVQIQMEALERVSTGSSAGC